MPPHGYRATAVPNFEFPRRSPRTAGNTSANFNPSSSARWMDHSNTRDVPSTSRLELLAIAWVTFLAIVCRLAALRQPMRYDESVTWAYFVGRPWSIIVSQYQFPNNHVFYSLLAKATSSLAAWQPWALRLPAAFCGIAIVPLTWAVGRRFADRDSALLGAALAAASTPLILYSTNARGYSLVVVLFLCLLLQAHRMREAPTMRDYALFAALSTLGLYTIPVMFYPIGVVATWLSLDAWQRPDRARRLLRLAATCLSSAIVAGVLYLPIVKTAGLAALTGNKFVAPSSWSALARSLPHFIVDVATTWAEPAPAVAALLITLLAINGMRRSASSREPSLAWSAVFGCVIILVLTRRAPFVRVWLFLAPLYLLAVARGVIRIARRMMPRRASAQAEKAPWPALLVASALAAVAFSTQAAQRSQDTGAFPSARGVVDLLATRIRASDRVLAPIPSNGPLIYYLAERGLDTASLTRPLERADRAFLVLDVSHGQTIQWALNAQMIDRDRFTDPVLIGRSGDAQVWSADRR